MTDNTPPSGRILGTVPCLDAVGRDRTITVSATADGQAVTLLTPPGESAIVTGPAARQLAAFLNP